MLLIGPACPICGSDRCYRLITPYWRNAIEIVPSPKKERIPIARFLCRKQQSTFSLLPVQLIPYCQYTVHAILTALLFGVACWGKGQCGFHGASIRVHPDSSVTPWLVAYWLAMIVRGFRRAHATLRRIFDLSKVRSATTSALAWSELGGYFLAFRYGTQTPWRLRLHELLNRYSRSTGQFLFGIASQHHAGSG